MTATERIRRANRWDHNPGSPEAVTAGCKCPVLDNAHGKGAYNGIGFYMAADCDLHGAPSKPEGEAQ